MAYLSFQPLNGRYFPTSDINFSPLHLLTRGSPPPPPVFLSFSPSRQFLFCVTKKDSRCFRHHCLKEKIDIPSSLSRSLTLPATHPLRFGVVIFLLLLFFRYFLDEGLPFPSLSCAATGGKWTRAPSRFCLPASWRLVSRSFLNPPFPREPC